MAYWNRNQLLRGRARSISELSQVWRNGNSARDTEVRQPRRRSYHGSMERYSPAVSILETAASLSGSVLTQIVAIEDLRSLRSPRLHVDHAYQPAEEDATSLEANGEQDTITLSYFYDQDSADAAVDDANQLKVHADRLLEHLPKHERNDLTSVTLRLQFPDERPYAHILGAAQATQMPVLEATVTFWLAEVLSELRLLCVAFGFGVLDTLSRLNSSIARMPTFDVSRQMSQHWWDTTWMRKSSDTALPNGQAAQEAVYHNDEMPKQAHRNSSTQSSVSAAKERLWLPAAHSLVADDQASLDGSQQQSSDGRGDSTAEGENKSIRQRLLMWEINSTTDAAQEAGSPVSDILKEHDDTKFLATRLDEILDDDTIAVTTGSRSTTPALTSQLQHSDSPSPIAIIQDGPSAPPQKHFVYRLGADYKLVNERNAAEYFRLGQVLCTPRIVNRNAPDFFDVSLHPPSLRPGFQESSQSLEQTIDIDIQTLVVIRRGPTFCTALPLESFPHGQSTGPDTPRESVQEVTPAVRRASDTPATRRHVVAHTFDEKLPPNTYLHVGKPQTLEHNLRYKILGYVHDQDVQALNSYFRGEMKRTGDARDVRVEVRKEQEQAGEEQEQGHEEEYKSVHQSGLQPQVGWT